MGDEWLHVQPPARHERGELLHPQPPAGHEPAVDQLVAHADAPVRARDLHIVPAAEIVDVADPPAGLQDLYDGDERIHIAARDDRAVDALSTGQRQHLLVDRAVFVADEVGRAVFPRRLHADRPRADREDPRCAPQRRTGHRHEPDRSDTDDEHRIAELHIRQLRAMKAGRHHVGEHARLRDVHPLRQMREIPIRIVDVEKLRKHTVFDVGELPARQHPAGVHGKPGLRLQ